MSRKLTAILAIAAMAMVVAFAASGSLACDKDKVATAGTKSCCDAKAKTASTDGCSAKATTASASGCSAHAKTASADGCSAHAKTASADGCSAHAKTASANGCSASSAVAAGIAAKSGCCANKSAGAAFTMYGDRCSAAEIAACERNEKAAAKRAALAKVIDEIPYSENKRLVVTGMVGCSKCSEHATESCSPLFKTADGSTYPLLKGQLVNDMRHTGGELKVSSRVRNVFGIKYLDVVAFESI